MAEKEAQIFVTDVKKGIISFRGTLNHGVQPSVFVLEIVPQEITTTIVDITLKYPHPVKAVEINSCLIDSSSFSSAGSGRVSTLYIKDFRWKWQYSTISLVANIRNGAGEIIDHKKEPQPYLKTKMTVLEIIQKVCDKLGVKLNNKAFIPMDYYPEVIWDNYNTALALNDIVSPISVRVCPSYDGKSITLYNASVGAVLPTDDLESLGENFDPREKPKRVRVVSAPIVKTMDFGLVPVIAEPDGLFDEAYKTYLRPDGKRWGEVSGLVSDSPSYTIASGRTPTTSELELVEQSLFKWYAIIPSPFPMEESTIGQNTVLAHPFGAPKNWYWSFTDNAIKTIETRYQVLRGLQPYICEQRIVKRTGEVWGEEWSEAQPRSAFVYGAFWHESESDGAREADLLTSNGNSISSFDDITSDIKAKLSFVEPDDDDSAISNDPSAVTENDRLRKYIVPVPFSIDMEHGLVKFGKPICYKSGEDILFPSLVLRAGFKFLNEKGLFERLEHFIEVDPNSQAEEIYIELNEVTPMLHYDGSSGNFNEVLNYLISYAQSVVDSLNRSPDSQRATYVGIKQIELDGAIQSVGWSVDASGARTIVSRNQDNGDSITLSHMARQRALEMGRIVRDNNLREAMARRISLGLPVL